MANPFDSDDDEFIKKVRSSGRGLEPVKSYAKHTSVEDQIAEDERAIEDLLQKSLDTTQRSRAMLDSSEKTAEQTARELLEQREKLERAEKNLDGIHHTTQLTQRSLNSLKSLFGGMLKNKFSRAPKPPPADTVPQQDASMNVSKSADQMAKVMDRVNGAQNSSVGTGAAGGSKGPTLNEQSRAYIQGTRWEAMDNEIDDNLDAMSSQLARLKQWGSTLGEEVDDQNRMLDRIQTKTERNDAVIRSQDGQMRKLLG